MREDYVIQVLRRLSVPTAELYFHPTTGSGSETLGPNAGDLATLLSPAVRQVIQERGLRLTTYPALHAATQGSSAPLHPPDDTSHKVK